MFTVTFYSYKGGVGRTLALANVAYTLATEGGKSRVVVVDFDLEAPGIDVIAPFSEGKMPEKGGVVEYLTSYADTPAPDPKALPSLLPYAGEVAGVPNLAFMPAGKKDGNYQEALTRLDWASFYNLKQGYLFFEEFKRKIEQELRPDYLLVDSRTGLTDVAGITTHQLADLVVLVFNLNYQNLGGIRRCYQSIVSAPRPRPAKTMLVASPVPVGQFLDHDLVRSRLEEAARSMPNVVECGRGGVDSIFQIPYHPVLSLMDVTFVKEYPTDDISNVYRRIAEAIQKCNPLEMKFLLEKAFRFRDENRFDEAESEFRSVIARHPGSAEALYHYGDFLMKRGSDEHAAVQLENACRLAPDNVRYLSALGAALANCNRTEAALEQLKRAEQLGANNETVLWRISRLYSRQGDSEKALEYLRKIGRIKPPETKLERLQLSEKFAAMGSEFLSASLNLPTDFDRSAFLERLEKALNLDLATKARILSSILGEEFSSQQIRELDGLLIREQERLAGMLGGYYAAIQTKVRRGDLRHIYDEEDLKRLIRQSKGTTANAFRLCLAMTKMSNDEYEEAVSIVKNAFRTKIPQSDRAMFYRIWGDALSELAGGADEATIKAQLLREAADKYQDAVNIRPDDHEVLNNWGNMLQGVALLRKGNEREALLKEACEKYARALEIMPDRHEVLYNWGGALQNLASLRESSEGETLLKEACERYTRAFEIKPDAHEVLNNWSNVLIHLSYVQEGMQRTKTLQAALEKARRAEEIKPGAGIYNMACAYSLLGQKKALAALKEAIERNPSHKTMAARDEDFRPLRENKSFQRLIAE